MIAHLAPAYVGALLAAATPGLALATVAVVQTWRDIRPREDE